MLPKLTAEQKTLASNIEGAVDRDTFVQVMTSNGVSISQQEDQPEGMLLIEKGDFFEARRIPVVVRKKLLRRYERKCGIPVSKFYGPIQ